MIKTEINEIRKLFQKDASVISKFSTCYVDHEKNIKLMNTGGYSLLPEEDSFKYEEMFKKTLSGSVGKQLLNIDIDLEEELNGESHKLLMELRKSKLEDEELNLKFFKKIIDDFIYPENYYIVLANIVYDVPYKTKDKIELDDASEEVYNAILCSICPVSLDKACLSYHAETDSIEPRVRDWIVSDPIRGFLFPAFNDRRTDIHSAIYFSRKGDSISKELREGIFGVQAPIPAGEQREIIREELIKALDEDCDYNTVSRLHKNLNQMIEENKETDTPLILSKQDMMKLMEQSGAKTEALERYETSEDADIAVLADNIVTSKKIDIKSVGINIKADADYLPYISTKTVEGKKCLVIELNDTIELNGISIKNTAD